MELLKKILSAMKTPDEKMADIHEVIENLKLISEGEGDISEFYRLCGDVFADEKDFWHDLAASERTHAEAALRMADLIAEEPGKYKPGLSFHAVSIRLFSLHLSDLVESMRAGKINKNELLSMAVDIEDSVVELNYGDMIETAVPEYRTLARRLAEETGEHRHKLEKRMMKPEQGG